MNRDAEGNPSAPVAELQSSSVDTAPNSLGSFQSLTKENLSLHNQAMEDNHTEGEECSTLTQEEISSLVNGFRSLGVELPEDSVKRMTPAGNLTPMERFLAEIDTVTRPFMTYKRNTIKESSEASHTNDFPVEKGEDQFSLSPTSIIPVDKNISLLLYLERQKTQLGDLHTYEGFFDFRGVRPLVLSKNVG